VNALQLDEVVIVGGGCYRTFYSRQLVEARRQIFAIEEQLTVARADAERLRPVADSWQRQVEANTQNAQQPRTRR